MKDMRIIGVAEATGAQSGAVSRDDRTNEDWSWMVGEDPAFYLKESE